MSKNTSNSILVVDDNPNNLRLLVKILAEKGYRVRPSLSGEHAMASIEKEPPDLILLDIHMPGLNGYEVCRHIKADKEKANIPVVFISSMDGLLEKREAFSAGGADYITKPFKINEVLARVETHLANMLLTSKCDVEGYIE